MGGDDELTRQWLSKITNHAAPVMQANELHNEDGEQFQMSHIFTGTADGVSRYVLLINPEDSPPAYLDASLLGEGLGYGYLYENPQLSSSGTPNVAHNTNRTLEGTKTGTWRAFLDPTVSSFGDVLAAMLVPGAESGGGPPGSEGGGSVSPGVRWVLAPGNAYLLRLENQSGQEGTFSIGAGWYEPQS